MSSEVTPVLEHCPYFIKDEQNLWEDISLKFIAAFLLSVTVLLCTSATVYATDTSTEAILIPQIQGEGAYLIDVQSGQTLFMKNPNELLAPASTTKIMTGLLAIEHGNLNETLTASPTLLNSKIVYGTSIYLEPGEKMPLRDLLYAMLLNSANDAAVTVAEYIGGDLTHFTDMMNQRAQEIGATQTHFLNPSGLSESGHLTTAHDLALIARVAYQNPVFAEIVRTKNQTILRAKPGVPSLLVNENKLLWRDSAVDGIKTGYTAAAKNCLVASITKGDRKLIGVILKSPGREIYTDMQSMFDYGFNQFENTVYKAQGTAIATINVSNKPVELILDQSIYTTQKKGQDTPQLTLNVILNSSTAYTTIEKGQVVAKVEVLDGGTLINTFPLLAANSRKPETIITFLSSLYITLRSYALVSGSVFFGLIVLILLIRRRKAYNHRFLHVSMNRSRRRESD